MKPMKGWKTWTGAVLIILSAFAAKICVALTVPEYAADASNICMKAGMALGGVGVAHKVEKLMTALKS